MRQKVSAADIENLKVRKDSIICLYTNSYVDIHNHYYYILVCNICNISFSIFVSFYPVDMVKVCNYEFEYIVFAD